MVATTTVMEAMTMAKGVENDKDDTKDAYPTVMMAMAMTATVTTMSMETVAMTTTMMIKINDDGDEHEAGTNERYNERFSKDTQCDIDDGTEG